MHISGKEGFSLPDFLSACASGGGKCNGEANCKTIQGFLLENGHLNAQGERIEIWDLPSSSLAFRIVFCTLRTTRIQEWVSDTRALTTGLYCHW